LPGFAKQPIVFTVLTASATTVIFIIVVVLTSSGFPFCSKRNCAPGHVLRRGSANVYNVE
jgi:hypothetical protein